MRMLRYYLLRLSGWRELIFPDPKPSFEGRRAFHPSPFGRGIEGEGML